MSLTRLLSPSAIAVVGLSADPTKHGGRVVANLAKVRFEGNVWGVNPGLPEVENVPVYRRIEDLPGSPDMVVCAIPAAAVPDTVRAAGAVKAGGVVVFAGGFSEAGVTGAGLQADLVQAAEEAGVVVLGPNSGGVIRPSVGLAASFLTCLDRPADQIRSGPVGLVTQSGGTGSYIHNLAAVAGSGLAVSISTGNEARVGMAECIDALVDLDEVRVIALVMETVRHGDRFMASVRRANEAGKKVVACRIGSSARGERLMATHTGAMAAPSKILDGVLASMGVVSSETPEEMLAIAEVLARSPTAGGRRVGVVTHSGGIAILLSDLAEKAGIDLPGPSSELAARLDPLLQLGVADNPLDMGAIIGGPGRFAQVVDEFARSGDFDSVLAVSTAHPRHHSVQRADGLTALRPGVPVVHLWMAGDVGDDGLAILRKADLPVSTEPRAAIRAMAGLSMGESGVPATATASEPLVSVPATEHKAKELLETWGLPVVPGGLARSADEAVTLASSLDGTVVMKISSPDIVHKTDVGGIVMGIDDPRFCRQAYEKIMSNVSIQRPDAVIGGVRVELMRSGVEAILGMVIDSTFGPMVMAGLGGVAAEGLGGEQWAPAPVSHRQARGMAAMVPGLEASLSRGGDASMAMDELATLMADVSLRFAISGLSELEMNPVAWVGARWEILDVVMKGES